MSSGKDQRKAGGDFLSLIRVTFSNRADRDVRVVNLLLEAVCAYRKEHPADCHCPGCFLTAEAIKTLEGSS
jgi:hypothetical protein